MLPTEERVVLRRDSVAAPKRNLADSVENWSVSDENWGVLDENSGPAGLAAWPAVRPILYPNNPPNLGLNPILLSLLYIDMVPQAEGAPECPGCGDVMAWSDYAKGPRR